MSLTSIFLKIECQNQCTSVITSCITQELSVICCYIVCRPSLKRQCSIQKIFNSRFYEYHICERNTMEGLLTLWLILGKFICCYTYLSFLERYSSKNIQSIEYWKIKTFLECIQVLVDALQIVKKFVFFYIVRHSSVVVCRNFNFMLNMASIIYFRKQAVVLIYNND